MTPTRKHGVYSQTIKPGLQVIVDENRNQIIKRKNGRAKIFSFDTPINLEDIRFTIDLITITEDCNLIMN